MRRIILISGCILLVVFALFGLHRQAEAPSAPSSGDVVVPTSIDGTLSEISRSNDSERNGSTVSFGKTIIFVELADTEEERMLGLGGRKTIAPDSGMLFVFSKSDIYGIWMKDMLFPLDILWLKELKPQTEAELTVNYAEGKKYLVVVGIRRNVAPETYPEVFSQSKTASFVLEINGGAATRSGIAVGSVLTFKQNTPI